MRLVILALLALSSLPAKEPVAWKTGKVLTVVAVGANEPITMSAAAGGRGGAAEIGVVQERFEVDTGTQIYTVEQTVARSAKLGLVEGDNVEFSVDRKTLLVKDRKGKVRKLKIVGTLEKRTLP